MKVFHDTVILVPQRKLREKQRFFGLDERIHRLNPRWCCCSCPNQEENSACDGGSGLCQSIGLPGYPRICKFCGSEGDVCCPNQEENSTCNGGNGYCKISDVPGDPPICQVCGLSGTECCPGDVCNPDSGIGNIVECVSSNPSDPTAPKICELCGKSGSPCCQGASSVVLVVAGISFRSTQTALRSGKSVLEESIYPVLYVFIRC